MIKLIKGLFYLKFSIISLSFVQYINMLGTKAIEDNKPPLLFDKIINSQ